jgi:hypothetical protein
VIYDASRRERFRVDCVCGKAIAALEDCLLGGSVG